MSDEVGGTFPIPQGRIKPTDPNIESVVGYNLPYRGQEMHGVPVEAEPWIPADAGAELWEEREDVELDEEDVKPVPVRIVDESASEIRRWSTSQVTADANPRELVGRNERRNRLTIRNLDAVVTVWVGRLNGTSRLQGYPIRPGEDIDIISTDEVHGVSDTAAQVTLAILQEFTVG